MILFEKYKTNLQKIIEAVSNTFNLEFAIFDSQSHLIASTHKYLQHKGKSVHAPSIEEVLINENILVNKPGYMKSCIGCRFKEQCPSTIEILNCIKVSHQPVGVITLASFTKSDHIRITENISVYTNLVKEVSQIISDIITFKDKSSELNHLNKILQGILESSTNNIIVVDSSGFVIHNNLSAHKLFSFCNLYSQSIKQILPEYINTKILSGQTLFNRVVQINSTPTKLSCFPLYDDQYFIGSVIKMSRNDIIDKSNTHKSKLKNIQFSLNSIKGNSIAIRSLKEKIKKIANSTSTVLITGETGTGKGLIAKAIHYESQCSKYPFIAINCASIPETLFESELFGYEEGAFTGAKKGGKPGKFELAQNGTLFLDEVGEFPLHFQAKLLTVLQEQTIDRIGGTHPIPINTRIIVATNKNLEEMIEKKEFRKDLYYRLNIIPINIPPLKLRKGDIEILAYDFLLKYSSILNKNINKFSSEVIKILKEYDWPGNIRELENVVEYAVNMEDSDTINLTSLPERYLNLKNIGNTSIKSKVIDMEMEIIISTLDKYGWDVIGKKAAAEELGIGLRTLYRKLKDYRTST